MKVPLGQRSFVRALMIITILIIVVGIAVGLVGFSAKGTSSTTEDYAIPALNSNAGGAASDGNAYPQSQPIVSSASSSAAETVTTVVGAVTYSSSSSIPSTQPISTGSGSVSQTGVENSPQAQNSSAPTGLIEFFSNVTVSVSSSQTALSKATAIAYSFGGYLAFSSYSNSTSIAVLRIPASNYANALSEIEGLGNLTGLQSTSNDVSIEYTDLNATLQSLLTEQASLLKLENSSTSLNSTLILESQIQNIDAQINEIQSQILQTRVLVDYSTITATFNVMVPAPPPTPLSLKITATPISGLNPLSVTFNAIVTGGSQPYITNYNFGDGSTYQGQSLIHTFVSAGTFNVTVTVTDANGSAIENYVLIHVKNPPTTVAVTSFGSYALGLLISVVEGIIEVAAVILPIALVVAALYFPYRRIRMRSAKSEVKT